MIRTIPAVVAATTFLGVATLRVNASIPAMQALDFAIQRGQSEIGRHVIDFRRDGTDLHVEIAIDIEVRLFFLTAFRYAHRSHETWRDGRLVAIDTRTDDDGTEWRVSGRAAADGFRVDGSSGSFVAPADILPTSYWSTETTRRTALLDTQRGRLATVTFEHTGRERIATDAGPVEAERYTMRGDLAATLWYTPTGEWVKLAFEAKGETVEYRPNHVDTALARGDRR
jgi:hypothetical protein